VVLGLIAPGGPSDRTRTATRFAVDEARLRGAVLEVVVVRATTGIEGRGPRQGAVGEDKDRYDSVVTLVESAGARLDDVELQVDFREGSVAGEWIAAAREADLLVIEGGRGRIAAASACRQVVYHADGPVAVIGCPGPAGQDHN
jgi:nucleotide-binding universal stress UspA family protein